MVNFEYRLLNFPSERLFKPRIKISGYDVSNQRSFLPFKEDHILKVSKKTDFIEFIDFFTEEFNFNNTKNFKEYVRSNSLYKKFNKIGDIQIRETLINKVTSTLKYPFVLKRMLQGLILDDTIYSYHLPFLIESASDLEASFLLIENGYFKQSLQTLRNVIELTLAHAYFGLKGLSYEDLAESIDFRMPSLRYGKNSLLTFLKENLIVDSYLEVEIIDLYQTLSGAVHSAIRMLNTTQNKNTVEYFEKWYNHLMKTSETNLKAVLRMIEVGM
jgi:hypothetical protein